MSDTLLYELDLAGHACSFNFLLMLAISDGSQRKMSVATPPKTSKRGGQVKVLSRRVLVFFSEVMSDRWTG
jgi:hypothetical protein